jgi:hypothetical protein
MKPQISVQRIGPASIRVALIFLALFAARTGAAPPETFKLAG